MNDEKREVDVKCKEFICSIHFHEEYARLIRCNSLCEPFDDAVLSQNVSK